MLYHIILKEFKINKINCNQIQFYRYSNKKHDKHLSKLQ